jgi:peptide/nickel transport system substrate-binding protein
MLESATAWKEQAKAAGITIDLEKLPADSYFANDKYLKVPAYQSAWGNAFEGWAPQALFKGATYNETHYDNPQWEADFRRAVGITEDDERNAALKELQVPIWEEGGYIIWGFQANIIATSANIKGAEPWAGFNIWMRNWYIEA